MRDCIKDVVCGSLGFERGIFEREGLLWGEKRKWGKICGQVFLRGNYVGMGDCFIKI